MKLIKWLPIGASARFECEKPDNWDSMTDHEKSEYFWENAETHADLCYGCAEHIESDYEPLRDSFDMEDIEEENDE